MYNACNITHPFKSRSQATLRINFGADHHRIGSSRQLPQHILGDRQRGRKARALDA